MRRIVVDKMQDLSRKMGFLLRHAPAALELNFQPGGWLSIREVSEALRLSGVNFARKDLNDLMKTDEFHRFCFMDGVSGECIVRANYGHSFAIDRFLTEERPPSRLYRVVPAGRLQQIQEEGFTANIERHCVPIASRGFRGLSVYMMEDLGMARKRLSLCADGVLLEFDTSKCREAFRKAEGGIWLTDEIAKQAIEVRYAQPCEVVGA